MSIRQYQQDSPKQIYTWLVCSAAWCLVCQIYTSTAELDQYFPKSLNNAEYITRYITLTTGGMIFFLLLVYLYGYVSSVFRRFANKKFGRQLAVIEDVEHCPEEEKTPITNIGSGKVLVGFGEQTEDGPSEYLIIEVAPGSVIVCPADGEVTYVGAFGADENVLIVSLSPDEHLIIRGLHDIQVSSGQFVRQDTILGLAETDFSAILVLELRLVGVSADPSRFATGLLRYQPTN